MSAKTWLALDGFAATQRVLARAPEVFTAHSADAVAASTYAVAQRARSLVPVDTGKLKSQINSTARGLSGRVGLSDKALVYWRFVEYGSVHNTPARPFFRPAAESEREAFVQRMRAVGAKAERDLSSSRFL